MSSYGVFFFCRSNIFAIWLTLVYMECVNSVIFFALYPLVFQLWDDMDRRFQCFPFFAGLTNKISTVKPTKPFQNNICQFPQTKKANPVLTRTPGNCWKKSPACRRVWLEGVVLVAVLGLYFFLCSLATHCCFVWIMSNTLPPTTPLPSP